MNNMQQNHDYHSYPNSQVYQPAMDQQMLNNAGNMHVDCGRSRSDIQMGNTSWQNNSRQTNDMMQQSRNNQMTVRNRDMMPSASTPQNTISLRPESMTNSDFLPAYLMQYIGKWIRADFLIGNSIEQRVGILEDVGASYIILNAIEPDTLMVCDLFAIKFVTIILNDDEYPKLLLV